MRRLYNLLFWTYFVLSAPFCFFRVWARGDWQKSFSQRFGHYDINLKQSITNRHLVWIQVPGLADVQVARALVVALSQRLPNVKFMVSTTTVETMQALYELMPPNTGKIYHPIDRRDCVGRALGTLHPRAIILSGGALRPNFVWRARGRFPMFLINARLSRSQYSRYKRLGFLFGPLFRALSFVGAQTEEQAARFRRIGAPADVVEVVGDLATDPNAIGTTVDLILARLAESDLYIAPPTALTSDSREGPKLDAPQPDRTDFSSPSKR